MPLPARQEHFESAWRQHLPALLDATTRAHDFADRVERLVRRVEGLESQQRQGQAQIGMAMAALAQRGDSSAVVETHPVGVSLPIPAGGVIRLHFCGPGVPPRAGYVNIARAAGPGIDLVSAGLDLPFAPETVTGIVAHGFLESVPQDMLHDSILPAWRALLQPGSRIRLIAIDAEAAVEAIGRGQATLGELQQALFSGASPGVGLHNLLWPEMLRRMVEEIGFGEAKRTAKVQHRGAIAEFEIEALRS